jgi:phosphatidylserine/phosphatidylglycerophosphate/cardiolipin synthase-like enzyme
MKKLFCALIASLAFATSAFAVPMNVQCQADVEFSPNGGGEALVVAAVNSAQHQILVQAYNFTSPAILQALLNAKVQKHLDVRLILDKSNEQVRYEQNIQQFIAARVPVATDYSVAIAHNKVMIIDGTDVITGSFNFTTSAQHRNAENVVWFTHCPAMAGPYTQNWNNRWTVSRPYQARQSVPVQSEQ